METSMKTERVVAAVEDEARWDAVYGRDRTQDGAFVYGVRTTGVYCRPSCPSRRPLRANVSFYASPAQAEAAGLRACRRCKPLALVGDSERVGRMRELCRYIESHADEQLTLAALARRAGLSSSHLQRSFQALVGVSPRAYAEACRLAHFKRELRAGKSVTDATYEAGFGSSSRIYERSDTRLGMTPSQYRARGRGVAISHAATTTALGPMLLGATDRGLCFIQFGDSPEALLAQLQREYPEATLTPMRESQRADFEAWMRALSAHLAGAQTHLALPLDIRGTAFQMKVWRYLQQIPYGEVQSYGEVAAAIGAPKAARAVASACARNRLAIAVPCHRVIRGSGELGGYRWGLERKRTLIDVERGGRR
jgi:AraC family transcriptional regulator, regulatory protein of adaptative response / methylated-DNA-[protein]-cysteine methyltransferase